MIPFSSLTTVFTLLKTSSLHLKPSVKSQNVLISSTLWGHPFLNSYMSMTQNLIPHMVENPRPSPAKYLWRFRGQSRMGILRSLREENSHLVSTEAFEFPWHSGLSLPCARRNTMQPLFLPFSEASINTRIQHSFIDSFTDYGGDYGGERIMPVTGNITNGK